jgi:uncharacterized PurR-regulated membrane protein YhhQ (DUF165 family)
MAMTATARRRPPGVAGAPAILAVASLIYVASIVGANWMIAHVGRPVGPNHVLPVGFGLVAPSGVYLAALTFVARDVVQRLGGPRIGVAAIAVGAALSALVASPRLALASGVTFLVSETVDFLVFTPAQRRSFPIAVLASGLVGEVIDSVLFLTLAGIPLGLALPGQLLGKAWVILAGGLLSVLLRRLIPAPTSWPVRAQPGG